MTAMTPQAYRELLRRQPFQPFRVMMSSGQSYEVRHPEMAMLTSSDLLVGLGDKGDGVPSEFRICSLLHITTIEPLNAVASPPQQ